jgi:hypothetical protein
MTRQGLEDRNHDFPLHGAELECIRKFLVVAEERNFGEHQPGVGDREHLIALGVAPGRGPQMHHPAAEVKIA